MTMRKLMLGAGLAFSFVGAAFAGERSRGTSGDAVAGGVAAAVAPDFREIAPGVGKMSSGGFELTVRADGSVLLSEVVEEYGSLERFKFEMAVGPTAMTSTASGARMYANGAVGFFRDLLGSNPPVSPVITTAEEYKSVMGWTEMAVGSELVVLFANGAIFNDGSLASEPEWSRHARTVASSYNGSDPVFADGAVFNH